MSLSARIRAWTCPVAASQIRTVPSLLAEASQLPSGATATATNNVDVAVSGASCSAFARRSLSSTWTTSL